MQSNPLTRYHDLAKIGPIDNDSHPINRTTEIHEELLVSSPWEDIGDSMLIAEELGPNINVPVEVVPMEALNSVLENASNRKVVTSRYLLQPVGKLA